MLAKWEGRVHSNYNILKMYCQNLRLKFKIFLRRRNEARRSRYINDKLACCSYSNGPFYIIPSIFYCCSQVRQVSAYLAPALGATRPTQVVCFYKQGVSSKQWECPWIKNNEEKFLLKWPGPGLKIFLLEFENKNIVLFWLVSKSIFWVNIICALCLRI